MIIHRLIVLISLFMVACQANQNDQQMVSEKQDSSAIEVQQHQIQGGVTEEDRTYVVGLVIQQGWAGGACSGSLIAPNLVLTAQHCIAPTSSQGIACGYSNFGATYDPNDIYVTTQTEFPRFGYYGVSEIIVPEPEAEVCGNDIALLVLNQNVMSSDAVPIRPRLDEPVAVNERFAAVGYGHTGQGEGAGLRRAIEDRRVICSGFQNGCQDNNQGIYDNEWVGNDGTCQGDSGGPALDVNERVIGVLSRGPEGCIYPVYTDVIRYAPWIRDVASQAATSGAYTPAAWVAGPDDGPAPDEDADGLPDRYDNCIDVDNPSQADYDQDGIGDLCDELVSGDRGGRCPVCNTCTNDSECGGQGAICLQLQGGGVCSYPCRGNFECPDTTDCIEVNNNEQYCLNSDVFLSGVCPQSYICGGEGTAPTPREDDGACHVCDACTRGEDCASGVCANIEGANVCTRTCESDEQCREGSSCLEQNGRKLCVNSNYEEVGICPEGLMCGADLELPMDNNAGSEVNEEAGTESGTESPMNEPRIVDEAGTEMGIMIINEEKSKSDDTFGCDSQSSHKPFGLSLIFLCFMALLRRRVA